MRLLPSINLPADTKCGCYHRSRGTDVAMQLRGAKQWLVSMNVLVATLVEAVMEVAPYHHSCHCLDRGQKTYKNPRYKLNPAPGAQLNQLPQESSNAEFLIVVSAVS